MIFQNIDFHNVSELTEKEDGGYTMHRFPVGVEEELSDQGKNANKVSTGVELRFRMISDNVRLIQTTSGSETFEQMMSLGEEDVFIAISFPRYSKSIIRGVEYAKSRGADVIALTDSENSPIAAQADQVLVAQSDMASYADSYVAPMSVINALIVAVSRECGDRFTERLHKLESVWDEYNVYDKSQV